MNIAALTTMLGGSPLVGTIVFNTAMTTLGVGSIPAGASNIPTYTAGLFVSGVGSRVMQIGTIGELGGEFVVYIRVADADAPVSPQTAFFARVDLSGQANANKLASNATFTTDTTTFPGFRLYRWSWSDSALDSIFYNGGAYANGLSAVFG